MTLNELICEGRSFREAQHIRRCRNGGEVASEQLPPSIEPAEEYANWIAKTIRFLSTYYPNDSALDEFKEISAKPVCQRNLQQLVATLNSLLELPQLSPS